MKYFIFIFFLICCSCNGANFADATIEYVEVYKTSFGINVPLYYNEKEARSWKSYRIDKPQDLEKIKLLLTLLVDSGRSKFNMTNVYMTCDVYLAGGDKKVLYYNKFKIKFDGGGYENSPSLIELLRNRPPIEGSSE